MTGKPVADDKMTNEELGALTRRTDELKRRVNQGPIPFRFAMDGLQRLLEGGFPIWKTVSLPVRKSVDELIAAIRTAGRYVYPDQEEFWKQAQLVSREKEFDLVLVPTSVFRFPEYVWTKQNELAEVQEFYRRAFLFGLLPGPLQLALELGAIYKDQSRGELLVATESGLVRLVGPDSSGNGAFFVQETKGSSPQEWGRRRLCTSGDRPIAFVRPRNFWSW